MSTEVLNPRQSGEFIAQNSKNVKIIPEGIEKIVDQVSAILSCNVFYDYAIK